MTTLADEHISFYQKNGYLFPLPAVDQEMALAARDALEAFEKDRGINLSTAFRGNSFLWLKCLSDIAHTPAIVDAVESLIGPDILCFSGSLFVKEPHDDGCILPWHQDGPYYRNDGNEGFVTAWVALTPSTVDNGAMRVLPGSHSERRPHGPIDGPSALPVEDRMLGSVDESQSVHLVLQPGEMSFHHENIAHASTANLTNQRRMGIAFRYVTPDYRLAGNSRELALLVRGVNHGENFKTISPPRYDEDPIVIKSIIAADKEEIENACTESGQTETGMTLKNTDVVNGYDHLNF